MPIYEYQCQECGGIQESLVLPGGSEGSVQCQRCGAANMGRVLSAHTAQPTFSRPKGQTCCGRTEQCDSPPTGSGKTCCQA
jgi:putative FmdB family regulatory protein